MKNKTLIIGGLVIVFGLMAFSFLSNTTSNKDIAELTDTNSDASDIETLMGPVDKPSVPFIYGVNTRYSSMRKSTLNEATSYEDFIGDAHAQRIVSYNSISVIVLDQNSNILVTMTNKGGTLNAAQKALLKASHFSTNLRIWADYDEKNIDSGIVEYSHWGNYITVVPEVQAAYSEGRTALVDYLKAKSSAHIAKVEADKLQMGQLYFKVSKVGTIEDAEVTSSCGYPEIDAALMELILNAPGTWSPAQNADGETEEQTFVFSYGRGGC